jgi:hypothetical protein
MIIGNLSSKICQIPSMHSIIMVADQPIAIMDYKIPLKRVEEQQQTPREVLNDILWRVLQLLTLKKNPSTVSRYYNILCSDGTFRCCKPIFAAWLADCPKYCDRHFLEQHVYFWCECPKNELGDDFHPDKQHPRWDHNLCKMLGDANTKAADAEPLSGYIH